MLSNNDLAQANKEQTQVQPGQRKPYAKPEIIHELELETRAGSPLNNNPAGDELLDPENELLK